MLRTIVDREIQRLDKAGYDSIVVTDEIRVDGCKKVIQLGCDTAVISGVYFDEDQMTDDKSISISSATSCLSGSMSRLTSLKDNIYKVMRQYISVTRPDIGCGPFFVQLVRISPKKRL